MPTIDIIIVSFNTRDLLVQCLDCVERARWDGPRNVFVVDNGSTDGSQDAIRSRFPQVRLIESRENLGFAQANNLALAESRGDYVLLLNPDTEVGTEALVRPAAYLAGHSHVGMVTCKLVTGDGSLDLACRRSFPTPWDGFCRATGLSFRFPRSCIFARYNLTYLDEDATYEVEAVNGAFMMCTRAAVDKVGPLDPDYFMYAEDLDWCYRFQQAGYKIVYHPTSTTKHLKGSSSAPRSSQMMREMFKSNALFCQKHYFPHRGRLWQKSVRIGMALWAEVALVRNALRQHKTARP